MGQGANRISARGLKEEIEETRKQLRQEWHQHRQSSHTYLFDHADAETAKLMEEVRLGKKRNYRVSVHGVNNSIIGINVFHWQFDKLFAIC